MQTIVVENVLTANGAIFSARDEQGALHRFVADAMPRCPVRGEAWQVAGSIRRHPRYGQQVHVTSAVLLRPSGRLVVDLLCGPRFPGIGMVVARRLWEALGEQLYDILDARDVAGLQRILGHSDRATEQIRILLEAWPDVVAEPQVIRWLDRHGFPPRLAHKLLGCYGAETVTKLEQDPYRLLAFTHWPAVDRVALGMGIDRGDQRRLVAACEAALYARLDRSHTWTSNTSLQQALLPLVGDPSLVGPAIEAASGYAMMHVADGWQAVGPHAMERWLAERVRDLLSGEDAKASQPVLLHRPFNDLHLDGAIPKWEREHRLFLNAEQREAVHMALTTPFALLLGGAGVGKTTVLRAVCDLTEQMAITTHLMALSGRAALRITEATGRPARTIAGWLQRAEAGELKLDDEPIIIIDEASMVDLGSLYRIFRTAERGCRFLLVGDPGQLPPVSFGITLHALAENELVPRVELTEVLRQAADTGIPGAALAVRSGIMPSFEDFNADRKVGVSFIDAAPANIVNVIENILPALSGAGVQIIGSIKGAGRREDGGTRAINEALHASYARGRAPLQGGYTQGEPVIWTINDYDLKLMNGSLGTVVDQEETDPAGGDLRVRFDETEVIIGPDQMQYLELAWAITTHKSQGSAFDTVVIPVKRRAILPPDRRPILTP